MGSNRGVSLNCHISVSRTGLWSSASSRRSDHLSIYHLFITISRADPTALLRNEKANQFYAPLNKNTEIIIHNLPKTPSKSLYNPLRSLYLYQYILVEKSCLRVKIYPEIPLVWRRIKRGEGCICYRRRNRNRKVGAVSCHCHTRLIMTRQIEKSSLASGSSGSKVKYAPDAIIPIWNIQLLFHSRPTERDNPGGVWLSGCLGASSPSNRWSPITPDRNHDGEFDVKKYRIPRPLDWMLSVFFFKARLARKPAKNWNWSRATPISQSYENVNPLSIQPPSPSNLEENNPAPLPRLTNIPSRFPSKRFLKYEIPTWFMDSRCCFQFFHT